MLNIQNLLYYSTSTQVQKRMKALGSDLSVDAEMQLSAMTKRLLRSKVFAKATQLELILHISREFCGNQKAFVRCILSSFCDKVVPTRR